MTYSPSQREKLRSRARIEAGMHLKRRYPNLWKRYYDLALNKMLATEAAGCLDVGPQQLARGKVGRKEAKR